MTNAIFEETESLTFADPQLSELVRGHETALLERFTPLVRGQDLSLDLRSVERIDAAGIAALISLYGAARDAGHVFTISNVSPRVAELLALIGLERIFASRNAVRESHYASSFHRSAA